MTNSELTVIITTFKSESKIDSCLDSIDSSIKIIVVENSSNHKFKEYIEQKYSNTECVLTNENLGYGKANNIGLKKAKSKYCLILNPDTILDKEAIKNFLACAQKNKNFYIIAPLQSKDEFSKNNIFKDNTAALETNYVEGFAMFLNMEKFSEIGFFDENIFLYLEEIDLCKRIINVKGTILIDPSIKIFHFGAQAVNKAFSHEVELTRNWHWMWSLFYFNKKHYNFLYSLALVFPKLFSSLLKSFFYKIIFKNKKSELYKKRLSGLFNSIIGKNSWYRPNIK
jgi:N-acetylglucosaminyl-diphospho-decaprenol L-rhamnosyltransferase